MQLSVGGNFKCLLRAARRLNTCAGLDDGVRARIDLNSNPALRGDARAWSIAYERGEPVEIVPVRCRPEICLSCGQLRVSGDAFGHETPKIDQHRAAGITLDVPDPANRSILPIDRDLPPSDACDEVTPEGVELADPPVQWTFAWSRRDDCEAHRSLGAGLAGF